MCWDEIVLVMDSTVQLCIKPYVPYPIVRGAYMLILTNYELCSLDLKVCAPALLGDKQIEQPTEQRFALN